MNKSKVYEEKLKPLLGMIHNICLEEKIPHHMIFLLGDDPVHTAATGWVDPSSASEYPVAPSVMASSRWSADKGHAIGGLLGATQPMMVVAAMESAMKIFGNIPEHDFTGLMYPILKAAVEKAKSPELAENYNRAGDELQKEFLQQEIERLLD